MPNAFQKLVKRAKDGLGRSKRETKAFLQDERSGHSDPFRPLATYHEGLQRLKEHFNPEAAARRDAFEEPNIVGDQQASYEHELAVGLQKLIIDLRNSLGSYVKNVQDNLNQGLPHEPTIEGNVILAQVSTERKSRWTTWTQRLEDARKTVKNARVGLQAFKTDNPSVKSRMAKHPPVAVAAVWMTAFAVVEGISNYLFLLGTGAQTPAESISICATTALLNLFCGAVLIGFLGIRYLSHAQNKERWRGRLFILIGVCTVITLHLGLAHFRMAIDALADSPDAGNAGINGQLFGHVSSTTWDTLRKAPLSFLRDIHSIIVFIAGCAFAAVAAFEGYFLLGDPYPGYQRVDDAYLDALDALDALQGEFAAGITQLTQRAIDTIDKALREDQERHTWIKAHLTDVSAAVHQYEQEATQRLEELFHMVDAYRSTYRRMREGPGPRHWRNELPTLNREVPDFLGNIAKIDQDHREHAQLRRRQAEQLKAQLNNDLAAFLGNIEAYLNGADQDTSPFVRDNLYTRTTGVPMPPPPSVKAR